MQSAPCHTPSWCWNQKLPDHREDSPSFPKKDVVLPKLRPRKGSSGHAQSQQERAF